MSDLHHLPLAGHDLPPLAPFVRARVYGRTSQLTGKTSWYWGYITRHGNAISHGPFYNWREAYDSARRMVELL